MLMIIILQPWKYNSIKFFNDVVDNALKPIFVDRYYCSDDHTLKEGCNAR
jgi:hypothetical protein